MTEAATLRCPSCGASVAPEVAECDHCRVALHPIRCPWCFGWTFTESRDCAHCGVFCRAGVRQDDMPVLPGISGGSEARRRLPGGVRALHGRMGRRCVFQDYLR